MKEIIVALDVDGVLMDCYNPVNKEIIKTFDVPKNFRLQNVVRSWNMNELPDDIRKFTIKCLGDANIVSQYKFKSGCKKFVKELYELLLPVNGRIVFNTHCYNDDVAKVRKKQLDRLTSELKIKTDYNISVGLEKENIDSYIIIDDCINNLINSNSEHKILYTMFHNEFLDKQGSTRVSNYDEIINLVKNILGGFKMKKIFIINGSGGVGKDTLIEYISNELSAPVMNFSSVDKVKEIAKVIGWDGTAKTEKDRELLYNLKQLCTKYNDLPFRTMQEKVDEFNSNDAAMLFLHIREPEEIERAKQAFSAMTLLVKRENVEHIVSNPADRDVYKYNYDIVVDTTSGLEELAIKTKSFVLDFENDDLKSEY